MLAPLSTFAEFPPTAKQKFVVGHETATKAFFDVEGKRSVGVQCRFTPTDKVDPAVMAHRATVSQEIESTICPLPALSGIPHEVPSKVETPPLKSPSAQKVADEHEIVTGPPLPEVRVGLAFHVSEAASECDDAASAVAVGTTMVSASATTAITIGTAGRYDERDATSPPRKGRCGEPTDSRAVWLRNVV